MKVKHHARVRYSSALLGLLMCVIAASASGQSKETPAQAQLPLRQLDGYDSAFKKSNTISLPLAYHGVYGFSPSECPRLAREVKQGILTGTQINLHGVVHGTESSCQVLELKYDGSFVQARQECFSEGQSVEQTVRYQLEGNKLTMRVQGDTKFWIQYKCK